MLAMENLIYESYPTKSSNVVGRSLPQSRISFAAGTRFTNGVDRRHSDLLRRSTYNIKPVKKERDSIMRFRAPSATVPVGPYRSVTKRDYVYPSQDLLRSMNPTPKWIYRSKSDLGIKHFQDNDYQYFNNGRKSVSTTCPRDSECRSSMSNRDEGSAIENENMIQSPFLGSPDIQKVEFEIPVDSRQFSVHHDEDANYYAFYKPLVGDSRDRYIPNAQFKRAVEAEGELIPVQVGKPFESTMKNHQYVPRAMRFTDTLNRVFEPKPDIIKRIPARLPTLPRRPINEISAAPVPAPAPTGATGGHRVTLYQNAPATFTLGEDMIRTYEKQAQLKQMIKK